MNMKVHGGKDEWKQGTAKILDNDTIQFVTLKLRRIEPPFPVHIQAPPPQGLTPGEMILGAFMIGAILDDVLGGLNESPEPSNFTRRQNALVGACMGGDQMSCSNLGPGLGEYYQPKPKSENDK